MEIGWLHLKDLAFVNSNSVESTWRHNIPLSFLSLLHPWIRPSTLSIGTRWKNKLIYFLRLGESNRDSRIGNTQSFSTYNQIYSTNLFHLPLYDIARDQPRFFRIPYKFPRDSTWYSLYHQTIVFSIYTFL